MARRKTGPTPPATDAAPAPEASIPDVQPDTPIENGMDTTMPTADSAAPAISDATETSAPESLPDAVAPEAPTVETTADEPAVLPEAETAVATTEIESTPPTPPRTGPGVGGMLVSGLAGGIAAAAVAGGAWFYGLLPLPAPQGAQSAGQQTAAPAVDTTVAKRLGEAEAAIKDITARLNTAEKALASKPAAPISNPPAPSAAPAAAPAPSAGTTTSTASLAVTARQEGNTKPDAGEAPISGLKSDLADAARRLGLLETAIKAPRLTAEDMAPLAERIGKLEADLARAKTALGDVAAQAKAAAVDPRSAAAMAVLSLRARLDRGAPFATELTSTKALVKDPARLAWLDAYAADGLPTVAVLRDRFAALAPKLSQSAAPAADKPLLERLTDSAQRIVRLRPVGETSGDDAGAIIARIEARLAKADLPGSISELAKLPPAAQDALAGWRKLAEARIKADQLAGELAAETVAALAAPAPQPQR